MATRMAYSYVRFSSKKQELGESLNRQLNSAREYAKKHNLILDERAMDLKKSAFRGAHKRAALGALLKRVESGEIQPGSVLIVESLDRLSRQEPLQAFKTFTALIEAGIEIVTLIPEFSFTLQSLRTHAFQLQIVLSFMQRANEESQTKSERVHDAWEKKRHNASAAAPMTALTPGWIAMEDGKMVVIPERKKIVIRMVKMAIDGKGPLAIALQFNREKVPTFSRRKVKMWDSKTVEVILKSRRLVGEYQPRRWVGGKPQNDGEAIANYYPPVLTESEFYNLQSALNSRKAYVKGRAANTATSLFSGLLYTPDGSKAVVVDNMNRKKYIRSAEKRMGNGEWFNFPYVEFETCFLQWVTEIKVNNAKPSTGRLAEVEAALSVHLRKREKLSKAIDDDTTGEIDSIIVSAKRNDAEIKVLERERETLKAEANKTEINTADVLAMVREADALPEDKRTDIRLRIRAAISAIVRRIDLAHGKCGGDLGLAAHVHFANNTARLFFIFADRMQSCFSATSISDDMVTPDTTPLPPKYLKSLAATVAESGTAAAARTALESDSIFQMVRNIASGKKINWDDVDKE